MVRFDRVTIREAAFYVMREAYMKASDNGRLPTRPRQIMYAARPRILHFTDKDMLDDRYFTQTLLPDYAATGTSSGTRAAISPSHTLNEIALGTLEVRGYLGLRAKVTEVVTVDPGILFPTHGPEHRFNAVLFIEKEGFSPLCAAEQLAENTTSRSCRPRA
jgi:hypothetical protein